MSPNDQPAVIYQDKNHRFADFSVTETSPPLLLAVMEDHTDPAPSKVKNSIVTISLDGTGTLTTLASGHDFYSSPQLQGNKLAYVAWDHPNMPWDDTTLYVQTLDANLKPVGDASVIHGGQASVAVPRWTPDGSLVFLSDHDGWYNLYEWQEGTPIISLCSREADFCSSGQGWIMGLSPFTVMPNGNIVSAFTDKEEGGSKLVLIAREKGASAKVQEFGRYVGTIHYFICNMFPLPSHIFCCHQIFHPPDFNFVILCYKVERVILCRRLYKGTTSHLVLGETWCWKGTHGATLHGHLRRSRAAPGSNGRTSFG
jgi:hypothetical protein